MVRYPNYYALLGVTPKSDSATIRRAYRERMLKHRVHPDLGGLHEAAAQLNEAYAVLKDATRRAAYNQLYLERIATSPEAATPQAVPQAERRQARRVIYVGHVQVRVPRTPTAFPGQCRDISDGGLSLRTLIPLRAGQQLRVVFAEDPGLAVGGVIRWQRMIPQRFGPPIYEGGIEFGEIDLHRFHTFCKRLGLSVGSDPI